MSDILWRELESEVRNAAQLLRERNAERERADDAERALAAERAAMFPAVAVLARAREWWARQGRFLRPSDGDDLAWDEYAKCPVPSWVRDEQG